MRGSLLRAILGEGVAWCHAWDCRGGKLNCFDGDDDDDDMRVIKVASVGSEECVAG